MKLRWYDRILVALASLVLIGLGVLIVLAAGGVVQLPEAIAFDTWLGDGWQWMPIVFAVGILVILWGIWLFIRSLKPGSEPGGKYYTLQSEEDGNVRISVNAIDHLVHKCIDRYEQVVSSKVKIGGHEDAMEITLHMTLRGDVQIPLLVEDLRDDIKQSLRRSAGVTVSKVQLFVDGTKDDKNADDTIKYLRPAREEEAVADPINTTSFYTTPVVVTGETKAEAESPLQRAEPTVEELKKEIDLGPDEPLPVELSAQAFPFPEEEAGVPLEIFTHDVPITNDTEEADQDV